MTQKEHIAQLIANKAAAIELKKAATKHADAVILAPGPGHVVKGGGGSTNDSETELKRTIIGNTYLFLDSHGDVHLPGIFSKSISENTPYHLHDHLYQVDAQVGTANKVYESSIAWTDLGIAKAGTTTALFMESTIERDRNPQIFKDYKAGKIQQHSVGMVYVKLDLAVNDEEYKAEKATWDTYFPQLGNPEKAEEKGFFWIVREAKLKEISCVLEGSNSLTPTLQLSASTENEPAQATPQQPQFDLSAAIKQSTFL